MKEAKKERNEPAMISRRGFVQDCLAGVSTLAALPILGCQGIGTPRGSALQGPASRAMSLDEGWLFGGKLNPAALSPQFDDGGFSEVTLPHCATALSWHNWDWEDWQEV